MREKTTFRKPPYLLLLKMSRILIRCATSAIENMKVHSSLRHSVWFILDCCISKMKHEALSEAFKSGTQND